MSVYLVSVCEITNMNEGLKEYAQKSAELIQQFGGSYNVRGPALEVCEGEMLEGKSLIITLLPVNISPSHTSSAGPLTLYEPPNCCISSADF